MTENPRQKWAAAIARHEAGHFVASKDLGFGLGPITLTLLDLKGGHKGGAETTLFRPVADLDAVDTYLRGRIMVLYAGVLAQALALDGTVDVDGAMQLMSSNGSGDKAKAEELLQLLRNVRFADQSDPLLVEEQLAALGSETWSAARDLIEARHVVVLAIAAHLAARVERVQVNYSVSVAEIAGLTDVRDWFEVAR